MVPTMNILQTFGRSLAARGCRPETIKLRKYHVSRAMDVMGPPGSWTVEGVEAYLSTPTWGPAARRSVHASLKALLKSMPDVEGAGVMDLIPAARVPRGVPRPAADSIIRAALQKADQRVQLMIELMAYGGLRRGEVATVKGEHIKGQWLTVTGKGGHARAVPLPPHLAARIRDRGPGWIFPGKINGHLSARRVGELVSECLPDGLSGHTLRHRYGTTAYQSSGDIRAVQTLLGHARLDTTMLYTAVNNEDTAAVAAGAWRLTG